MNWYGSAPASTADGPVRLLTHPRHFGYGFNPVNFYYCFDATDQAPRVAIVAEINNTPWGERHCYVLPQSANRGTPDRLQFEFDKDFHVSPFMPMDMEYDWRFTRPDDALAVHMENRRDGRKVFDATLDAAPAADHRALHSPPRWRGIRSSRSR